LQNVTRDSVVAADGGVYERAAIKKWIEECFQGTCGRCHLQEVEGSIAHHIHGLVYPLGYSTGAFISDMAD
jgi:hypothetical protein